MVSGLRRGAELVAAEAALDQRLKLAAVLPFPDPAARYPEDLRSRFDAARGRADFEIVLAGDPTSPGVRSPITESLAGKRRIGRRCCGRSGPRRQIRRCRTVGDRGPLSGSVNEIVEKLQSLRDRIGVNHVVIRDARNVGAKFPLRMRRERPIFTMWDFSATFANNPPP